VKGYEAAVPEEDGPGLVTTPAAGRVRHDQLTNAALAAWFGTRRYTKSKRKPRACRGP
jgi:hypothetical protein